MHELVDFTEEDVPPPPPGMKYSRSWAAGVLREFQDKYSKASHLLEDVFPGLSNDAVIGLLQDKLHQERWESYKLVVKYLHHNMARLEYHFSNDYVAIVLHIRKVVTRKFIDNCTFSYDEAIDI